MKAVIMGLGSYEKGSGISAAKFFIGRGDEVLITDLKTKKDLARQIKNLRKFCRLKKRPLPKFVLGEHREADILSADIIIRNPGVPKDSKFLALAEKSGAKIETDISIFMKACAELSSAHIIGVTGTRGKSTTATLIYEILRDANVMPRPRRVRLGRRMPRRPRIWLGGNIKISPLSFVNKVKAGDVIVLELSSWMLENFKKEKLSPHIAVVTNIYPDHLNTYKNMAEYIAAKKNIFACQKKSDYLVLNGENNITKKWKGPGKIIKFYKKEVLSFCHSRPVSQYGVNSGGNLAVEDIKLQGAHNLENIAAALAVAKIMKIPAANIKKVLKNFRGLPDRQELIAVKNGVKYINDTTATTPDGTIAALRVFGAPPLVIPAKAGISSQKRIILICGGKDKNLKYNRLAKEIKKYCKAVILLPGSATEKIQLPITNYQLPITMAKDMSEAVNLAKRQASKGDIVLLSPAAASFGLFQNEFDRGEKFKSAVKINLNVQS